ncbi:MAG: hypothetical protein IK079_02560 [Desulfovibrio sp.]|nr:hypothetical protein [Desulfovibrio sp.]
MWKVLVFFCLGLSLCSWEGERKGAENEWMVKRVVIAQRILGQYVRSYPNPWGKRDLNSVLEKRCATHQLRGDEVEQALFAGIGDVDCLLMGEQWRKGELFVEFDGQILRFELLGRQYIHAGAQLRRQCYDSRLVRITQREDGIHYSYEVFCR